MRDLDVFNSERYWQIMNYLASPNFDAQTMMGTLPIQLRKQSFEITLKILVKLFHLLMKIHCM